MVRRIVRLFKMIAADIMVNYYRNKLKMKKLNN